MAANISRSVFPAYSPFCSWSSKKAVSQLSIRRVTMSSDLSTSRFWSRGSPMTETSWLGNSIFSRFWTKSVTFSISSKVIDDYGPSQVSSFHGKKCRNNNLMSLWSMNFWHNWNLTSLRAVHASSSNSESLLPYRKRGLGLLRIALLNLEKSFSPFWIGMLSSVSLKHSKFFRRLDKL